MLDGRWRADRQSVGEREGEKNKWGMDRREEDMLTLLFADPCFPPFKSQEADNAKGNSTWDSNNETNKDSKH